MNKLFYARLAGSNVRKNASLFVPYLLTCTLTVAMFYLFHSLGANPGLQELRGGDTLWGIAEEYCPRQLSVKSYVKELKQINRLKTDDIHAGNYLTVVYYSDEYK